TSPMIAIAISSSINVNPRLSALDIFHSPLRSVVFVSAESLDAAPRRTRPTIVPHQATTMPIKLSPSSYAANPLFVMHFSARSTMSDDTLSAEKRWQSAKDQAFHICRALAGLSHYK